MLNFMKGTRISEKKSVGKWPDTFFIILLNYKVKKKVIGSNESKQFSCMKNNNLKQVLANYGPGTKFG